MREVVFQELVKKKGKKRSLCIQESFSRGKYLYISERKAFFRLKEIHPYNAEAMADLYKYCNPIEEDRSRNLSLLRVYNKKTGENFWQSKITGTLYVVHKDAVLTVSFMQVFKMGIQRKTR